MFKFKPIIASGLIAILSALPVQAHWSIVERQGQTNSFVMSIDEAVEAPEDNKTYAYIEYGVVAKIVLWNLNSNNSYITQYVPASSLSIETFKDVTFLAEVPQSLKINYTSVTGDVKAEAINQGDIVAVVQTLDPNPLTNQDIAIPVTTQVVSTSVNADYSTSITLAPPTNNNPNQTVEVQVITNGISFTSVTTDNTSNPITINNLPSNEYVTVQTIFRDTMTAIAQPYQEVPLITPDSNIPVLVNARDVVEDKATIASPQNQVVVNGDSKSVTVSFDSIANWDPSKTSVSIQVVGPGGSTTSIGVGGDGGSVTIDNLGADLGYTVKMVIIDLATSQETIVLGSSL